MRSRSTTAAGVSRSERLFIPENNMAGWTPITIGGDAPPPAGAYSPAIRAGDFLYVSGQVPRDPKSGETIGTTVEEQTRQCVKNLEAVLAAGGAKLEDVVSVVVHLSDPDLW